MPPTRGSPSLTYTKQSDGYICRQRTRVEKKPNDDWKIIAHLIMGTCCLAAFLYIISEDPHQHHHHQRSVDRFLRSQHERIVNLAATASSKLDGVLRPGEVNPDDEMVLPPDEVMPDKVIPEVPEEEEKEEEVRLPEPIEKEE